MIKIKRNRTNELASIFYGDNEKNLLTVSVFNHALRIQVYSPLNNEQLNQILHDIRLHSIVFTKQNLESQNFKDICAKNPNTLIIFNEGTYFEIRQIPFDNVDSIISKIGEILPELSSSSVNLSEEIDDIQSEYNFLLSNNIQQHSVGYCSTNIYLQKNQEIIWRENNPGKFDKKINLTFSLNLTPRITVMTISLWKTQFTLRFHFFNAILQNKLQKIAEEFYNCTLTASINALVLTGVTHRQILTILKQISNIPTQDTNLANLCSILQTKDTDSDFYIVTNEVNFLTKRALLKIQTTMTPEELQGIEDNKKNHEEFNQESSTMTPKLPDNTQPSWRISSKNPSQESGYCTFSQGNTSIEVGIENNMFYISFLLEKNKDKDTMDKLVNVLNRNRTNDSPEEVTIERLSNCQVMIENISVESAYNKISTILNSFIMAEKSHQNQQTSFQSKKPLLAIDFSEELNMMILLQVQNIVEKSNQNSCSNLKVASVGSGKS